AVAVHDLIRSFTLGLRFDLRVALLCSLMLLIGSFLPWLGWHRSVTHKRIWFGLQMLITAVVVSVFFFDFGHYSYLEGRISSAALEHLRNPEISGDMLRQSYNLPLISTVYVAVLSMLGFLIWRF